MKRRMGILALALALPLMAIPAEASPIAFGSGSTAIQSFFGDNFSFSTTGRGFLTLDTAASSSLAINTAKLDIVDYTNANGGYETRPLGLSFYLTLDGVTHTLTQNATWSITPTYDSILVAASAPMEFDTTSGSWGVSLNSFSVGGGALGTFTAPVTADIRPVPEPASIVLLGTALVGGGIQRWRKRRMNG